MFKSETHLEQKVLITVGRMADEGVQVVKS